MPDPPDCRRSRAVAAALREGLARRAECGGAHPVRSSRIPGQATDGHVEAQGWYAPYARFHITSACLPACLRVLDSLRACFAARADCDLNAPSDPMLPDAHILLQRAAGTS